MRPELVTLHLLRRRMVDFVDAQPIRADPGGDSANVSSPAPRITYCCTPDEIASCSRSSAYRMRRMITVWVGLSVRSSTSTTRRFRQLVVGDQPPERRHHGDCVLVGEDGIRIPPEVAGAYRGHQYRGGAGLAGADV